MKNDKQALVPRLRFPEFQGAEEWTTAKLGSLTTISIEKVGDKTCIPMSITSGVGLVSQEEKFGRIIAGDSYKNYLILKPNDFAYNKSATKEYPEGFLTLYSGSELAAVPNSIFTCFRVKGESPDPRFLNYLFLGNLHGRWLRKFIQVGARAHGSLSINDNDLMALPIPLPAGKRSVAEQQKIADCLSSLDALIAAQADKIDALKTHKKGLMQQLFPREGETVPRLRFPEFRDKGEWEERSLKEVFSIFQGFAFSGNDSVDAGVRWLKIADVSIQQMNHHSPSYLPVEYKERFRKFSVAKGEYVIALTRPILNGQLKMAKVDRVFDGALLNQRVGKLVTTQESSFVYFLLQSCRLISDIEKSISGTEPPNLSAQQIEDIKTCIPKQTEQQRIADCLSSLDAMIAAHTEKLDALKAHKKGLMQQLFPSSEVVGV
ncbi:restriction endonuclease subunit S [Billgrantia ethanolica]|uniref:Restriction endonuclease subunit S n=1 Tax=Billgrantia ethanolica TaxID=2733486 RepID=A0ABS9A376_9GAMM|nr:restriction endonuclease subunit S [Halomonas ethanolica]MCE8003216.1 restriction endonuclease subunit S [Halomonas ethanolica]